MLPIPEFHARIYIYAKKRAIKNKIITYEHLKSAIRMLVYRQASSFYTKTIEEMIAFKLIKEISFNTRKHKKYIILTNENLKQQLRESNSFPIKI